MQAYCQPNVVLVTIDSLRADHLGCYGYQRSTSPYIDSLAEGGRLFEKVYATGPNTPHSFPGIMAGVLPFELPSFGVDQVIVTMPEVFKRAGYQTAAFNEANPHLIDHFGYGRGFKLKHDFLEFGSFFASEAFEERKPVSQKVVKIIDGAGQIARQRLNPNGTLFRYLERKKKVFKGRISSRTTLNRKEQLSELFRTAVTDWICTVDIDRPFFLWVHFMTVHYPYYSTREIRKTLSLDHMSKSREIDIHGLLWSNERAGKDQLQSGIDLYDASIRYVDESIEMMVEALRERHILNRTLVAITSDHGEEFYEHGESYHRSKLYEELVRVPLLFYAPKPDVSRVREPVSLVSLPSMLTKHAGLSESVPSNSRIYQEPSGMCFFQAFQAEDGICPKEGELTRLPMLSKLHGCIMDGWKAIYSSEHSRLELFEKKGDSADERDCSEVHPGVAEELLCVLKIKDRHCERRRLISRLQGSESWNIANTTQLHTC